jgi:hypothetical protein
MANTPNHSTTFGFFERFKKPAAGLALAIGVLSVSACNEVASAEKAPTTAGSTMTPGANETPIASTETTAPSTPDVSATPTTNPELASLAGSTTPEKLQTMTPEELEKIFTINIKDLDKDNLVESYLERVAVLEQAREKSGMTKADLIAPGSLADSFDPYYEYTKAKYFDISTRQLWGNDIGTTDASFYNSLHQNYIENFSFDQPYDLSVALDKSTIKVTDEGTGQQGDSFSVTAGFKYKESYDATALTEHIGRPFEPLDKTQYITIDNVIADQDGNLKPGHVEIN